MIKYTIRGFRNGKLTSTSGATDALPNSETAKRIATSVKGEGIINCFICILTDEENKRYLYEGSRLKVD